MKTALITGGAKRVGRAITERLAGAGYAVAIHCHGSREEADALARAIGAGGGQAAVVQADLADAAAVARILPEAQGALGPVTLLVNNASLFEPDEVETIDLEGWDRHFAVNLRAPAFLARDFARLLPADMRGAIVNIVDQRVWKPTPLFFSYSLTKAGLWAATRTTAQALAPKIRVNAVGPGPTLKAARQSEADFERQRAALLLGHGPDPEDIADAVLFLAEAQNITGQMLAVDGGQHLAWRTEDVGVGE